MHTITLYHRIILFSICAIFLSVHSYAQKSDFFNISFKDSLIATEESSALINNIKITNPQRKTVRLGVLITIPKNWKRISQNKQQSENEFYFNLYPGTSKSISLNLLKTPKAKANWDSVKIAVWVRNVTDTFFYYYRLQAKPNPKFTALAITEDVELTKKTRILPLKFRIKNTGNVNETYTLKWENRFMELDEQIHLTLAPDKDTNYTYDLKIPSASWKELNMEDVLLSISGEGNRSFHHSFRVTKPRSGIKLAKSPYTLVPVTFEAGLINRDTNTFFFGALSGRVHFAEKNELSFMYRSKQFGSEVYGFQQHMYLFNYFYHNWEFSLGTIPSIQNFFASNARGVGVTYSPDKGKQFAITAHPKDPNFYYTSNNVAMQAIYPLLGKYRLKQTLTADFNDAIGLNGYVQYNELQLIDSPNTKLGVRTGIGVEEKTWNVPNIQTIALGWTGGYIFDYTKRRWSFNSNVDYFTKNFPGANRGLLNQMHQLSRIITPKFTAGIFYQAYYVNSTIFRDTLYNSDILRSNSQRIGVNAGFNLGKHALSTRTGFLKLSSISDNELQNMYFFDVLYSHQYGNDFTASFNAQNAFRPNADIKNNSVFIHTSNGILRYKWVGIAGTYTRFPIFQVEGQNQQVLQGYDETLAGGPSIGFALFRNKVVGNVQYILAKSMYDNTTRTNLLGTISYRNYKTGTGLQIAGSVPLRGYTGSQPLPATERPFFSVSLLQPVNIPVVTKRKFYTLKMSAFDDKNGNGVRDKNEKALENIQLDINNKQPLYSNKQGTFRYLNIPKGYYSLNFNPRESEGLVPANGLEQGIDITKNTTIAIPYKKGKMVTGRVTIIRDSFASTLMTADNIKILATDGKGRSISVLTNADGKFTFYLPSEEFTISLNEEAFKGSDYKPDRLSYVADLVKNESVEVNFTIRQKQRKVRFLKKQD